MRSWSPSPHCSLEGSGSLQEPHHPFTLEKVQMLSYFFMCDNEKGREALMSTIVLSRVWHTVSSQLKYYRLMAWLKDMIRQCILNSRYYDYYYYIFSLFFVPQLKEGTHDTYGYFIILNLIDLLFYLLKILTSLSFVTWHSAFPLSSVSFADSSSSTGPLNVRDFPNLVLHPFLSLSEPCQCLPGLQRQTICSWTPNWYFQPISLLWAPDHVSNCLPAISSNWLRWSEYLPPRGIRAQNRNKGTVVPKYLLQVLSFKRAGGGQEVDRRKEERKGLKYKFFLAHLEFVPTLIAISNLSYLFQFFDFTNPSYPNTHANEQIYHLPLLRGH